MNDLKAHLLKSQKYLKLGDKESFIGNYVTWEHITNSFGSKAYRVTLEREDGSRLHWDCTSTKAMTQLSDLLDKGLVRGDLIKIYREGLGKDATKYTITEEIKF